MGLFQLCISTNGNVITSDIFLISLFKHFMISASQVENLNISIYFLLWKPIQRFYFFLWKSTKIQELHR